MTHYWVETGAVQHGNTDTVESALRVASSWTVLVTKSISFDADGRVAG
jgi:hypothetical protein